MKIKLQEIIEAPHKKDGKHKNRPAEKGNMIGGKSHSNKILQKFYENLHRLLESGLDLISSLKIIQAQQRGNYAKDVASIRQQVTRGAFLSEAIAANKRFHAYDAYLLAVGEKTGKLTHILKELDRYYAHKVKLRQLLVSALSYPLLVIGVSVGVLYFMVGFLIPTFKDIYIRMGVDLPALTQWMLAAANTFSSYAIVLPLLLLLFIVFLAVAKQNTTLKERVQKALIKLPILGSFILEYQLMRFSHAMYLLLTSKVPLTESLTLSARLTGNIPFKKEILKVKKGLIGGNRFHELTKKSTYFDAVYTAMIQVGEQTGTLAQVFEKLFHQKLAKMNRFTKMMGDVLEPILIIGIGGLVALVLMAMYLPMFGLSGGF